MRKKWVKKVKKIKTDKYWKKIGSGGGHGTLGFPFRLEDCIHVFIINQLYSFPKNAIFFFFFCF